MAPALNIAPWRGLYTAHDGRLFGVCGKVLYYIDSRYGFHPLGSIAYNVTPVSMADNFDTLVLVDGSPNGYSVDLTSPALTFAQINDPAFQGADKVDILDGFFIFNVPGGVKGSQQFYSSLDNELKFDPLFFADKNSYSDDLITLSVVHREIWLLGRYKSEIWYNAGNAQFPFAELPGSHIEHGIAAKYSVASHDLSIFWVGRNLQGGGIIYRGRGYQAVRISNHAIENEIQKYPTIEDAVAYCYQQGGHAFYVVHFPSGDKTWVFDDTTEQWHQWAWKDSQGELHRHRGQVHAYAYGKNIVGDWQNGMLYVLNPLTGTDAGAPIERLRSFPHSALMSGVAAQRLQGFDDGKRIRFNRALVDIDTGTDDGTIDSTTSAAPPIISLRWSNTRGHSWGNKVTQSMGAGGQYLTRPQFQRLGIAVDRVFELSWSTPAPLGLNSLWIDAVPLKT